MNRKMRDYTEIKSSLRSKIRSRPKVASAGRYLDLYILNQEKARLEQELRSVTGRMKNLESILRDHQKSIADLEKELQMKGGTEKNAQKAPDNPHKAMSIEY
ncbi:MAG: hypothetical protein HY786_07230 [Deltaproteobacteria bacterium]|nr:hypothetical protein [Deltaproteobacteria bacterium]